MHLWIQILLVAIFAVFTIQVVMTNWRAFGNSGRVFKEHTMSCISLVGIVALPAIALLSRDFMLLAIFATIMVVFSLLVNWRRTSAPNVVSGEPFVPEEHSASLHWDLR